MSTVTLNPSQKAKNCQHGSDAVRTSRRKGALSIDALTDAWKRSPAVAHTLVANAITLDRGLFVSTQPPAIDLDTAADTFT
jgi:hypothetical protein